MYQTGDVVRYAGGIWSVVDDDGEDRIRIRREVNGGVHVATLPASCVRRPYFYGPNGAVAFGVIVAAIMAAFILLSVGCRAPEKESPFYVIEVQEFPMAGKDNSVYIIHYLLDARPYEVHVRGAAAKAQLFDYFDRYR